MCKQHVIPNDVCMVSKTMEQLWQQRQIHTGDCGRMLLYATQVLSKGLDCLENPTDGGAWWAPVHGVANSRAQLSDFTFTFHFHALENKMATHSSILAWRIPGTGEPGGLPSMGSHRVGRDWSNLAAAAADRPQEHTDDVCFTFWFQSLVKTHKSFDYVVIKFCLLPWNLYFQQHLQLLTMVGAFQKRPNQWFLIYCFHF